MPLMEPVRQRLLKAACNGQADVVKMLMDNQANSNARTDKGVSPLRCASAKGHLDVVKTLIETASP